MDADVLAHWARRDEEDVAEARRRLKAELVRLGVARAVVGEGELMVSELVTNAVRYGWAPITLAVWLGVRGCVVVEVRDARPGCPVLPSPIAVGEIDPDQEGGRGLPAVTAFSGGLCGAHPIAEGKTVWFALPLEGAPPPVGALATAVRVRHHPPSLPPVLGRVHRPIPMPRSRLEEACQRNGPIPV